MNQPTADKIWLPMAIFSILALGMYLGMRIAEQQQPQGSFNLHNTSYRPGKVEEVLSYIQARYMDSTNRKMLEEQAIQTILNQLDPHSIYIPPEEVQDIQEQMSGQFEGIGIEFQLMDDTVVVISPLSGSPAEEVGIRPGDKIIAVNDSLIAGRGFKTAKIVQLLKGSSGTKVKISIMRFGVDTLLSFTPTRAQIPIHSVDAAYMIRPHTGYIKLNRFSANAYTEFMQALDSLVEQHQLKNLILDLRGNPGGYLPEAIKLLNQLFTEKDILLLYTEGLQSPRQEYKTHGRALFPIEKVVVLIDEGSASASEIIAGALQDQDRGLVIGRRSFGKGLVQEQYELSDGSALRLTIAHYYTPSGRSIQKPYKTIEAYEHELVQRQENGEFFYADSIKLQDTTHYYTRKGREVKGGGGIIPDIFVPIDSIYFSKNFNQLQGLITPFILQRVLNGKQEAYDLPRSARLFLQQEIVSQEMFKDFQAFAKSKKIQIPLQEWTKLQPHLRQLLKAQIARQLFGLDYYYRSLNENDPDVRTALKVIEEENPY